MGFRLCKMAGRSYSNPNPGTAPTAVPAPTVPGQNLYGEAEALLKSEAIQIPSKHIAIL